MQNVDDVDDRNALFAATLGAIFIGGGGLVLGAGFALFLHRSLASDGVGSQFAFNHPHRSPASDGVGPELASMMQARDRELNLNV